MNIARRKIGGIFVGLVGEENNYRYILMSDSESFKSIVSDANAALSGRGGGRAPMASGSFAATLQAIRDHFA